MRARENAYILRDKIERRAGFHLTLEQANILRRAEKTLQRWYEQECGDGNDYASWAIERDESTDSNDMLLRLTWTNVKFPTITREQ